MREEARNGVVPITPQGRRRAWPGRSENRPLTRPKSNDHHLHTSANRVVHSAEAFDRLVLPLVDAASPVEPTKTPRAIDGEGRFPAESPSPSPPASNSSEAGSLLYPGINAVQDFGVSRIPAFTEPRANRGRDC